MPEEKQDYSNWSGINEDKGIEVDTEDEVKDEVIDEVKDEVDDSISDSGQKIEIEEQQDEVKDEVEEKVEEEEKEEPLVSKKESTKLESDLRKNTPKATEDEIKSLLDKSIKDLTDERKLDNASDTKFKEVFKSLREDPKNKKLTDEKVMDLAIDKIGQDLKSFNPLATVDMGEDVQVQDREDWKDIAKSLSVDGVPLELEENSHSALQESIDNEVAKVEAKVEEWNDLDQLGKDLAMYVSKNGMDALENFSRPNDVIERHLNSSDETLAELYIKQTQGNDLSESEVKGQIEDMQENVDERGKSEFDRVVRSIRTNLRKDKQEAQSLILSRADAEEAKQVEQQENKEQKRIDQMGESLNRMDSFLGSEVPKELKANIKKQLTPAFVRKYANNPDHLLKTIIMDRFGTDIIKGIAENQFELGRNKGLQLSRNIPDLTGGKSVKSKGAGADEDDLKGDFSDWGKKPM